MTQHSFFLISKPNPNASPFAQWVILRQIAPIDVRFLFSTRLTSTPTVFARIYSIFRCIFMPLRAVGFASINSPRTLAAMTIFLVGYRFNMSRIHAMANPTQMVTVKSWRNWIYKYLIDKPMSLYCLSFPFESGIPKRGQRSRRFPTRITLVEMFRRYFNLGEQTGKKFTIDNGRVDTGHFAKYLDYLVVWLGLGGLPFLKSTFILPHKTVII